MRVLPRSPGLAPGPDRRWSACERVHVCCAWLGVGVGVGVCSVSVPVPVPVQVRLRAWACVCIFFYRCCFYRCCFYPAWRWLSRSRSLAGCLLCFFFSSATRRRPASLHACIPAYLQAIKEAVNCGVRLLPRAAPSHSQTTHLPRPLHPSSTSRWILRPASSLVAPLAQGHASSRKRLCLCQHLRLLSAFVFALAPRLPCLRSARPAAVRRRSTHGPPPASAARPPLDDHPLARAALSCCIISA